jgi:hypothetical protein
VYRLLHLSSGKVIPRTDTPVYVDIHLMSNPEREIKIAVEVIERRKKEAEKSTKIRQR